MITILILLFCCLIIGFMAVCILEVICSIANKKTKKDDDDIEVTYEVWMDENDPKVSHLKK